MVGVNSGAEIVEIARRATVVQCGLNDVGNADRLVRLHGEDVKWCRGVRSWFRWDGCSWVRDETDSIVLKMIDSIRVTRQEAQASSLPEKQKQKVIDWTYRSESYHHIIHAIELAKAKLPVTISEFDRWPTLLNTRNGTIDLQTGKLIPHDRAQLHSKVCDVEFHSKAKAPAFQKFLRRIVPNADTRTFLQRWIGYCLTGLISEQAFVIAWGAGKNGKSTLTSLLQYVLGPYCQQAPQDLLLASKYERHPTELADLRGARLVLCGETPVDAPLDEAKVKALTGGDRIKARVMRGNFFEIDPTWKLILATNYKPRIQGTDEGIWRRVHLLPFTVTISEAERDSRLIEKLRDEASGVLAWAVQGALRWFQDGLRLPTEIVTASETYHNDADLVRRFITERCVNQGCIKASEFHKALSKWWIEEDFEGNPPSSAQLKVRLTSMRYQRRRTKHGFVWADLSLGV